MILEDSKCITLCWDDEAFDKLQTTDLTEEMAILTVKTALLKENDDRVNSIQFKNFAYHKMHQNSHWSELCYIETESAGYYFIIPDMLDTINVIYNRWD